MFFEDLRNGETFKQELNLLKLTLPLNIEGQLVKLSLKTHIMNYIMSASILRRVQ